MKHSILIFSAFLILSCSSDALNEDEEMPFNKETAATIEQSKESSGKRSESTEKDHIISDSTLVSMWTWGDNIEPATKSTVSNQQFEAELLFKKWTFPDNSRPLFTYSKDYLNIHNEGNYIYSVNFDSLRIFTDYDHPGDGYTRGIIKKITEDSLVIHWSTGDINRYVPISK